MAPDMRESIFSPIKMPSFGVSNSVPSHHLRDSGRSQGYLPWASHGSENAHVTCSKRPLQSRLGLQETHPSFHAHIYSSTFYCSSCSSVTKKLAAMLADRASKAQRFDCQSNAGRIYRRATIYTHVHTFGQLSVTWATLVWATKLAVMKHDICKLAVWLQVSLLNLFAF